MNPKTIDSVCFMFPTTDIVRGDVNFVNVKEEKFKIKAHSPLVPKIRHK